MLIDVVAIYSSPEERDLWDAKKYRGQIDVLPVLQEFTLPGIEGTRGHIKIHAYLKDRDLMIFTKQAPGKRPILRHLLRLSPRDEYARIDSWHQGGKNHGKFAKTGWFLIAFKK